MTGNFTRLILGAALGLPVAAALFFIMQYLIISATPDINEEPRTRLADIHMPDREIETNIEEQKPDKVDDPEEPPPDLDTPDLDMDMNMDIVNVAPSAKVDLVIDGTGMSTGDGEYLPIVKVAPIYPRRAQSRGISGYCIVEYTVTTSGAIRDPQPV
ncbi:MAG: energy transducer TonB, partial [Pseudomonadota bacterium]